MKILCRQHAYKIVQNWGTHSLTHQKGLQPRVVCSMGFAAPGANTHRVVYRDFSFSWTHQHIENAPLLRIGWKVIDRNEMNVAPRAFSQAVTGILLHTTQMKRVSGVHLFVLLAIFWLEEGTVASGIIGVLALSAFLQGPRTERFYGWRWGGNNTKYTY